jgi:hypothetical protein
VNRSAAVPSALLSTNNQVISKNPRIRVTDENKINWHLHLDKVREEDEGQYMCQLNTMAVKKQYTYLSVLGESSRARVYDGLTVSLFSTYFTSTPALIALYLYRDRLTYRKGAETMDYGDENGKMSSDSREDLGVSYIYSLTISFSKHWFPPVLS